MRAVAPALAVLLLLSACSSGGGKTSGRGENDESARPAPFVSDGPLLGVVMAARIDASGRPVRPGLKFSPKARQITAIVPLADVGEGETLTVAWYQLTGPDERERLFEHRIETKPFARAYSVGVPQSRLLPGAYEVVATLGDYEVRSPWVVGDEPGGSEGDLAAVASGAEAAPPAEGDSGTIAPDTAAEADPLGRSTTAAGCRLRVSGALYPGVLMIEAVGSASSWRGEKGACGQEFVLAASAQGADWHELRRFGLSPGLEVGDDEVTETVPYDFDLGSGSATFHPCELERGSDDPGTVIDLKVSEVGREQESAHASVKLEPVLDPFVGIAGEPPPGARVEPGQQITIHAFIMQAPGPGLMLGEITADGTRVAQEEWEKGVPCDPTRHFKVLSGTYRVPPDPPPVVTVEAAGADHEGRIGEATAQYFTGEVWTGTITQRGEIAHAGCSWTFEGPARVAVAADGSAFGSASGVFTEVAGPCTGPIVGRGASLRLSGSKDADRFQITTRGLSFDLRVNGQTAEGSTREAGISTWTLDLMCETCQEGVG